MGRELDGELELQELRKLVSSYEKARNEGSAPLNPALEELLSAMRSERTLNEENLRIPGVNDYQNEANAEEITPIPFYFAKFWGMEGSKYFVNMCGCPKIAAPGNWQNGVPPELEESLNQSEMDPECGASNLRFPLSCSDHMFSTDKNFKIPKGKYKGDIVRKHFIRADKVKLVSEVPPAESDPTFPLLLSNPTSQTFESQGSRSAESVNAVSLLQSAECHAVPEDGTRRNSCKDSNESLIDTADSPLMHYQVAESSPKDSDRDIMPMIQVTYIGRPVELAILILDFPSPVNAEELNMYASNLELCLHIRSQDPMLVPLSFATPPLQVKAAFYSSENRLEVYCPFLSYTELLA